MKAVLIGTAQYLADLVVKAALWFGASMLGAIFVLTALSENGFR